MTAARKKWWGKVAVLLALQALCLIFVAKAQDTTGTGAAVAITPANIAEELARFIVMATIFLGGPLGIIYSFLEKKALNVIGNRTYLKGCLTTVAGLLCFLFALAIDSNLSLYYICTAVPGVIGGASIFKDGTNDSMAAVKARRPDQDPPAGN